MSVIINPKNPSVPDEPHYPIDTIYKFDRHDRISWERAFGEQAPAWDPGRPAKSWADTSVLEGVADPDNTYVEYDYFDMATRRFAKLRLSVSEAATPNLKGAYIYPEFIVPSTPAVIVNPDGGENSINPRMLCYRSEANELARQLNATSIVENRFSDSGKFTIEWRGEQRRMWLIRIGANYHNVGLLLQRQYRGGIGAPGEWTVPPTGQPVWVARKQETGSDARGEVPVPCRPLAENEALYLGHPMKVIVYRTDMESDFNQPTGDAPSVFPADLRATLERIDANLQQLLALSLTD
jgi:hypothetical protein